MIKRQFKNIFWLNIQKWRQQRFNLFLSEVILEKNDLVIDLGGYDGKIMSLFNGDLNNYNIIVADIDKEGLKQAKKYGFATILLKENEKLPFENKEVDCIFCNSVIEHVTIDKSSVWNTQSSEVFYEKSMRNQLWFANEIRRCAKKYFVQTPHKIFPIESHTWFPFIAKLSRSKQITLIKLLNKLWIKKTKPDWNLLTENEMRKLFPDAKILVNKKFGFPKEIIAVKNSELSSAE